jgi:hypothetical protein
VAVIKGISYSERGEEMLFSANNQNMFLNKIKKGNQ